MTNKLVVGLLMATIPLSVFEANASSCRRGIDTVVLQHRREGNGAKPEFTQTLSDVIMLDNGFMRGLASPHPLTPHRSVIARHATTHTWPQLHSFHNHAGGTGPCRHSVMKFHAIKVSGGECRLLIFTTVTGQR